MKPSRRLRELFLLQTLGDDRAVAEVYVSGKPAKSDLA
jgi:guanine deaminase